MNRSSSWAVAILLLAGLPALAEPPAVKAVLLDDLSILEGTVQEFDGGFVRVTPATGAAKVLSGKSITYVGDSRDKVYDFVASKANIGTADGSLKLAGWCEKVGMTDRALSHARAAAALAPTDSIVREAVVKLEKAVAAKPRTDPAVKPAAATAPTTEKGPPQVAELPADAGIVFASKVQPVLLNQCANCHAQKGHTGAFKLTRIAEGYTNPEATAANLKATAGQLNRDNPTTSPLLTYSLTTHGGQKLAAFGDRQRPAFQHLETWVLAVLPKATGKGFAGNWAPKAAAVPEAEPVSLPGAIVGTSAQPVVAKPFAPPAPVAVPPAAVPPKSNSRDPFDPGRFNSLPKKAEK
ncbi:hypothetical protein [Limnoglobus roseus]|uniref:Cytochrome c domain-containing protein n=1 Tax=Limnoglobus roseus TaxID=2598579 RepID=A0A5C1AQ80_9BACT|nr:hypothetical protein [Limnoglobus roseus]QEL20213.1 hypothetical protein PX52LOC_07302 [Limnoglobus roseus]